MLCNCDYVIDNFQDLGLPAPNCQTLLPSKFVSNPIELALRSRASKVWQLLRGVGQEIRRTSKEVPMTIAQYHQLQTKQLACEFTGQDVSPQAREDRGVLGHQEAVG